MHRQLSEDISRHSVKFLWSLFSNHWLKNKLLSISIPASNFWRWHLDLQDIFSGLITSILKAPRNHTFFKGHFYLRFTKHQNKWKQHTKCWRLFICVGLIATAFWKQSFASINSCLYSWTNPLWNNNKK